MHIDDEHAYIPEKWAPYHTHAPLVNSGESGGGSLRSGYFIPFPPPPIAHMAFFPDREKGLLVPRHWTTIEREGGTAANAVTSLIPLTTVYHNKTFL